MTTVSLSSLDIVSPCNTPYEFEHIDAVTNKPTGIFFSVLGAHSDPVKTWLRKSINASRNKAVTLGLANKEYVRPFEEDEQDSIESAAVRLVGWRGITETFSPELAIQLCASNPEIKKEILTQSDNLANFTKSK
jgi:hypothetical protein